jgi:two-component system cell cycle sensor histidine kinase/response regulator CckA
MTVKPTPPGGGNETILVVEDRIEVLTVVAQILELYGYKVLTAKCGAEALESWEQHSGNVDLLFTDLVMPGMNGADLAAKLQDLKPGLKVLFTSGSGAEVVRSLLNREQQEHCLEKPYPPKILVSTVRTALDR